MTAPTSQDLLLEQDGRTAILTFNRPDARNALTWDMYEGLYETCDRLDHDPEVRVLVLRGAGDKAFVSGTDIRQFLDFKTEEDALSYEARSGRILGRLASMNKPTIAMVQGDAIGGGLFMALACDLRLTAEHARFGVPVARTLGNFPAPANFSRLVAAIGPFRAREMLLTARLLEAAEARAIGLVDQVHPAHELESRVRELAARLGELAPLTLAAAKEATRRVNSALALREAEGIILSCYLSEDFQEGVRAFLEKRKPNWQGK
jgi:enoyl-CoA hydratase/carnithine racemase